jgi:hypothetical protein
MTSGHASGAHIEVTFADASHDFGLTARALLVVSSRALPVLRQFKIDDCEVIAVSGDIRGR